MRVLFVAVFFVVFGVVAVAGAESIAIYADNSSVTYTPLDALNLVPTGYDLHRGYWMIATVYGRADHNVVTYSAEGGAVKVGPFTVAIAFEKPFLGIDVFLVVYKNGDRVYKEKLGHVGVGQEVSFAASLEASLDCEGVLHFKVYNSVGAVAYTDTAVVSDPVRVMASPKNYKINDVKKTAECTTTTSTSPGPWPQQPNVEPSDSRASKVALGAGAVGLAGLAAYVITRRG